MQNEHASIELKGDVEAAHILRAKSPLLPADFAKLDAETKKRAITVTNEVSRDAIRNMRDALAKAKADGVPYREFVKEAGHKLGAQWGIDSPQLKTIFVNNVQQATNQAVVARLNKQRTAYPYWTLDVVNDEVTSATCGYFLTHPVVLPAGHLWFATNAPMRHHRCRSMLRGLSVSEAKQIGISKAPPDWPADKGWGGSAPMGEYKANMSDIVTMADGPEKYSHIDFVPPKGAQEEAKRGLEWRREHGRGGTAVGVARARDLANAARLSPSTVRRMKAFFDRHQVDKKGAGFSPGEDGFPSNGRIAWALWGGDPGYAWARKVVAQLNSADEKAKNMKDSTKKADNGQADVHADGPVKVRQLKPITTKGRKALPDESFALPETRQYPIHDAAHARNAMARLEQNKGRLSPEQYAKAHKNILKAYKRFGIKHEGKPVAKGFRGLRYRTNGKLTSIHVYHMSDRPVQCSAVELDTKALLDDAGPFEPQKLVWIQLNKLGAFRGHQSGPFEITRQVNAEIVRNFRATQNQRIPIDFEHASEQHPTEGAIPTDGAPAQGWIIDLDDRGAAGLWGLVEWLEPARSYIKQGKYKFFSPAIRFGAKDRVTSQPIGARMTSGALTNNPFLDGMLPVAASDRPTTTTGDKAKQMGDYAYNMNEVLPKLRACLFGEGSIATARAVLDRICELRELIDEYRDSDPEGDLMTAVHAGVDLGTMLRGVRDTMQMNLGITVPELLDAVEAMIADAIGIHEDEMHGEGPPSSREMGNTNMSEQQEVAIKLRDAENKLATLLADKQASETKVAGLELQLADKTSRVAALETEVKQLRDNEAKRAEADEVAAIEKAFATYKDTHKLTDAHKKSMLLTYRHDRPTFNTLYPEVAPNERHLQRTLSNRQPGGDAAPQAIAAPPGMFTPRSAWAGGGMSSASATAAQRGEVASKLATLTEEKVRKGMPRENAIIEARHELSAPPPVVT
jgi:hypothetical protein